ncbi:CUB and sushi domain-containing protein 3-like [Dendronephthya gigantea]|uniref:CUB and sushi domain-containing protein 3-like n=1 Tax=Dendronephthya gigantea TaxID=151771 RepID=UPI00106CCD16|nr:CUB and sushi domain-containing protein 3-like [Dendronephthya gigantea]
MDTNFRPIKSFLGIFCFAILAHLIQASEALLCPRTNAVPSRHCTDECIVQVGCRNSRKKCLCDGDCGYSCVYPNIRCSRPRRIRNGRVTWNQQYRFSGTQTVKCNPGFQLSGSVIRTCRGNGYWDGKQARCKRLQNNCQDPGTSDLLLRTTKRKKSYKPGTRLNFYCPHKFSLRGSRSIVCGRDGTWSASVPKCVAQKCTKAVLPAHTYVRIPSNWESRREYGVRFSLSCDHGYTSIQRGTLLCDVPDWQLEPSTFKCFPKSCPNLGRPRNGDIRGLFHFKEKVYYTCKDCYELRGPSYRVCQADQTWSDTEPTCEPVRCSFLQNPTNGYLTSNSQQCNSIVEYHCDHGYNLNGSPRRRCQSDGTWSGDEATCEAKRCRDPGTLLKGRFEGDLEVGKTIKFSCDDCYKLLGSSTRTCKSDLTWTGQQPTCIAVRCSRLQRPRNGRSVVFSTFCGRSTEFRCDPGYQLRGSWKVTCQVDGTWSAGTPLCLPVRTDPPNKLTTAVMTTIPTIFSTSANPTLPKTTSMVLKSTCGHPSLPQNAKIHLHRKNILLIGCKENYVSLKFGWLQCNLKKRQWTIKQRAKCLAKSCSDPGAPMHGYKQGVSYFISDEVTFGCDHCYRLVGSSRRTCLKNETWSGTQPTCELITCPTLKNTDNATVEQSSRSCNEKATYTCRDSRLTILGSGQKICNESGMWEGAEPKCIYSNPNIALGKPTSISSFDPEWGGPGRFAVDGKRAGTMFHTKWEIAPWLRIDLQREETISTVIVVNRRDCCVRRMNDFTVSVGNNGTEIRNNAACGGRSKARVGPMIIDCRKPLRGRYVSVYLPFTTYLRTMNLVEVEVYRLGTIE